MRAPEMKTQSPSGSRGRAGVRISNLPPWLSLLCMVIYIKEEPAMQISVYGPRRARNRNKCWEALSGSPGSIGLFSSDRFAREVEQAVAVVPVLRPARLDFGGDTVGEQFR